MKKRRLCSENKRNNSKRRKIQYPNPKKHGRKTKTDIEKDFETLLPRDLIPLIFDYWSAHFLLTKVKLGKKSYPSQSRSLENVSNDLLVSKKLSNLEYFYESNFIHQRLLNRYEHLEIQLCHLVDFAGDFLFFFIGNVITKLDLHESKSNHVGIRISNHTDIWRLPRDPQFMRVDPEQEGIYCTFSFDRFI